VFRARQSGAASGRRFHEAIEIASNMKHPWPRATKIVNIIAKRRETPCSEGIG
jgi:hypothetical protein